jgi:hypothetical protein
MEIFTGCKSNKIRDTVIEQNRCISNPCLIIALRISGALEGEKIVIVAYRLDGIANGS